jgi:hypothetical protein
MITVEVPIQDSKNPPQLEFPARCVNCGKPKQVVLPMKLNMGVEKRGRGVLMDFPVPLCAECERKEKRVVNVSLVPFIIAGLLTFVIVFIPVWLITPDGETIQTIGFSAAVGTFAGIIAGLIGGTVAEFALKILFAPAYGKLLLQRPLTILGLFHDSEDVIGLSARFTEKKKSLKLTFENDEIGKEFERINS